MLEVVNAFIDNKDEENAIKMANYMKNNFQFIGLRSPLRKELEKEFLKAESKNELNKVYVLQLWSYKEREFQYFAIDYLIKMKKHLKKEDITLLETLILTKPWWDTVDLIASHLVGDLCLRHPELINEYILRWSTSDNIWLKRTAILYQLKYKEKTDVSILKNVIMDSIEDKDFFIRKAIGWALREYSKFNRVWVKEFILKTNLSQLSVKEGSKYL